jgi:hypothetical protein
MRAQLLLIGRQHQGPSQIQHDSKGRNVRPGTKGSFLTLAVVKRDALLILKFRLL